VYLILCAQNCHVPRKCWRLSLRWLVSDFPENYQGPVIVSQSLVICSADHARLTALLGSEFAKAIAPCDYLHDLRKALRECRIADEDRQLDDIVTMCTTVVLRDLMTHETETLMLVYPEAADISRGLLSVLAPLGAAIVGRRIGDRVHCQTVTGARILTIEAVSRSKLQPATQQPSWAMVSQANSLADRP
jgi:regulator of nucleoside diphosphate kinase